MRLNVNTITIAESLYRGIPHTHKGIQLLNNAHCDFVYSWGIPMGSDTDKIDCMFKPSSGTVNGNSNIEFEFIVTPKKSVRTTALNSNEIQVIQNVLILSRAI